jgi:hypothetical protein
MSKCAGFTQKSARCRRAVSHGSRYCHGHDLLPGLYYAGEFRSLILNRACVEIMKALPPRNIVGAVGNTDVSMGYSVFRAYPEITILTIGTTGTKLQVYRQTPPAGYSIAKEVNIPSEFQDETKSVESVRNSLQKACTENVRYYTLITGTLRDEYYDSTTSQKRRDELYARAESVFDRFGVPAIGSEYYLTRATEVELELLACAYQSQYSLVG